MMINGVIFEGHFTGGACESVGKLMYANGDIFFGQHRGFVREGQGKMIYLNGSSYEGGWSNDRKNSRGRMYERISGDIYNGEYLEGKRNGRGRMYYFSQQEIYDGEWSNDRRQGDGFMINRKGEICSGDFRADHMEGKLTFVRTLSQLETQKVFKMMIETNDIFISVTRNPDQIPELQATKSQISASTFIKIRKATTRQLTAQ